MLIIGTHMSSYITSGQAKNIIYAIMGRGYKASNPRSEGYLEPFALFLKNKSILELSHFTSTDEVLFKSKERLNKRQIIINSHSNAHIFREVYSECLSISKRNEQKIIGGFII